MARHFLALPLLAIVLTGCGSKLSDEKTFEVDGGAGQNLTVPATKSEQKVKVSGKVEGGAANVYVFLKKNQESAEKLLFSNKDDLFLAKKMKVETIDMEVSVPANEDAIIHFIGATPKKVKVNVKITN